jgi:Leucine-rich repeat (LRR) protein
MLKSLILSQSITYKHLEILSKCENLYLESLVVDKNNLDASAVPHLIDLLEQFPITHLDVSSNMLMDVDLVQLFGSTHVLESIVVSSPWKAYAAFYDLHIITNQNCPNLRKLHAIKYNHSLSIIHDLLSDIPVSLTDLKIHSACELTLSAFNKIFSSNVETVHITCYSLTDPIYHEDVYLDAMCINTSITRFDLRNTMTADSRTMLNLMRKMPNLTHFRMFSTTDDTEAWDDITVHVSTSKIQEFTSSDASIRDVLKTHQIRNRNITLLDLCTSVIARV